jgi:hypothetical protein
MPFLQSIARLKSSIAGEVHTDALMKDWGDLLDDRNVKAVSEKTIHVTGGWQETENGSGPEPVMLLGDAGTWDKRRQHIQKIELAPSTASEGVTRGRKILEENGKTS